MFKHASALPALTWLTEENIKNLPPARGVASDTIFRQETLGGWIFLPHQELTAVQLYLNGQPLAFVPLWERPDVAALYRRYPHSLRSGYGLKLPPGLLRHDDVNQVTAIGYHDGKAYGRQRTTVFADEVPPKVPIPPPDLLKRTQGHQEASAYQNLGYRFYRDVLNVVAPHRPLSSIRRVLDWGCGTGRVAANFLEDRHRFVVHACDPHAPSVAWCQENLPAGHFDVSPSRPPLQYPDSAFDLVLALGVVYHFNRDDLAEWVAELKRVLSHRGILVMSIQGAFAASVRFPADALESLEAEGILDSAGYDALHPPPADEQLFRGGFYWSAAGVKRVLAPHFRVLDFLEGAFTGDQDLLGLERLG
jgi:SAM-dependent methyltransferase